MRGDSNPAATIPAPQPAVAFLAYQLADRWGNRRTPRPSPRSEVLAAVLALGCCTVYPEHVPAQHDPSPGTADAAGMAAGWTLAVDRAAAAGPYIAFLVSCRLSDLVEEAGAAAFPGFLDEQEGRRRDLRRRMEADPGYRQIFGTGAHETNRHIVSACHTLAGLLARGVDQETPIPIPTKSGDVARAILRPAGRRRYRLSPWPFLGRRLAVSVHGYGPGEPGSAADGKGGGAWPDRAVVHLRWILASPGEPF